MSNIEKLLHGRVKCPYCQWRDARGEHQLALRKIRVRAFRVMVKIECSECGRVSRLVLEPSWDMQGYETLDKTVPVKSLIPF